jgi:hypothetical protein
VIALSQSAAETARTRFERLLRQVGESAAFAGSDVVKDVIEPERDPIGAAELLEAGDQPRPRVLEQTLAVQKAHNGFSVTECVRQGMLR